jgi:tetratricopeptide (TPR) repeat protein
MTQPTENRPQPTASRPSPDSRPRLRIRPLTWLFLAAIVGPCAFVQVPREIGRWHLAAALNLRRKGDKEAAYQELTSAMERFPRNPELLLQRAEWRMADGQREEAIADCDQILEVGGDSPDSLRAHAQFLQVAGEFRRAVEDWKKLNELSQRSGLPSRPEALNGLAYAQALAKIELDDALTNVNQALELQTTNNEAIFDTRGYIFHLKDTNVMALSDLDRAVKGMDAYLAQVRQPTTMPAIDALGRDADGSLPRTLVEVHPSRGTTAQQIALVMRSVAVIHYHRSLVLAALDRQEEAEAERAMARKLIGKDPDETLF